MQAKGLRAKPWAIKAGLAAATVRNFLSGEVESLSQRSLEKLAAAAETTVAEIIGERTPQPRAGREIVTVQGLRVQAALGGGVEISDESEGQPFYFRKSFIDRIARGGPARLRVIELTGDSMLPTLLGGDVALIDLASTDPASAPGLYCVWTGTGRVVKRVSVVPGERPKLRLQSDNPAYQPDEVDLDEVRVIGRVIWRGGAV